MNNRLEGAFPPRPCDSHVSQVIEVLRFPLIALVVLFHAFSCSITLPAGVYDWHQPVTDFLYWNLFHDSIATAAVPLFFAISGFLYFNGVTTFGRKVWWKKTEKRVFRLIVPLLSWALLSLLYYVVLYFCGNPNETAKWLLGTRHSTWWWINAFLGLTTVMGPELCSAGWFVRDLFFAGLLSPVWYLLLKRKRTMIPLLGALFVLYLTIFAPLPFLGSRAMFFFCLGAAYAIHHRDFTIDAARALWPSAVLWLFGFILLRFRAIPFLPRIMPMLVIPVVVGGISRGIRKGWFRPVPWLAASAFFVYFCHVSLWLKVPLHFMMTRVFVPYSDWACLGFILLNWVLETVLCISVFLLLRRFIPATLIFLAGIHHSKRVCVPK